MSFFDNLAMLALSFECECSGNHLYVHRNRLAQDCCYRFDRYKIKITRFIL